MPSLRRAAVVAATAVARARPARAAGASRTARTLTVPVASTHTSARVSAAAGAASAAAPPPVRAPTQGKSKMASLYDFTVKDIKHQDKSLKDFAGHVVLVVNVASKCGYTRQYDGLQKLYAEHKDKGTLSLRAPARPALCESRSDTWRGCGRWPGLVVVGFPCNQFGGQEPGTNEEIQTFCSSKFNVTFPLMDKVDVNGAKQAPVYTYLKKAAGAGDIGWNFEKFLIDRNGNVVKHYKSGASPESLVKDIAPLL
jgi:glutathione peroxidase-family protein